jgi:hypothetical protein
MEGEVVNTEPTDGELAKPEPTIVINNQTVPLSKAEETLKQMEHNLKSGYDKKHQERTEQMKQALADDIKFYASHDQSEWGSYQTKVGAHIDLNSALAGVQPPAYTPEPTRYSMPEPDVFKENETIRNITNKVSTIEQRLAADEAARNEAAKNVVIESLRDAQNKFPYANVKSVSERLSNYFHANGVHPTPDVVRQFMKEENDFVMAKVNAVTSSGKPSVGDGITPPVTGAPPEKGRDKIPRLDDDKGMIDRIAKRLSTQ